MDTEFVNAYIERLIFEVNELNKTKMLRETQLDLANKTIRSLTDELNALKEEILNKKPSKSAKDNTF
jgi:hypothetical protein